MNNKIVIPIILGLSSGFVSAKNPDIKKPNILLILADDLGWSDLGCYGGEIQTPNINSLAEDGLRFTQFYNSARCSPSRASILTGLHPKQAGFQNLGGRLSENAVLIPEVLKNVGYRSTMVGKWHLGNIPPTDRGFDEFYGMIGGFNSYWQENPFYTRWPKDRQKRVYDSKKFYSTEVFADYSIDFIGDGKSNQPWFQYLAFNAPHFPLHAYEADIAKYEKMYFEKGGDLIRDERMAKLIKIGLMDKEVQLSPLSVVLKTKFNVNSDYCNKPNPEWKSLPEDRRRDLARRMATYAAAVDRMDVAIGRVIDHLKKTDQFDNTVIFFLSDNGACAEWDPFGFDTNSGPNNILHIGDDLKTIGAPGSYVSYGSAWANTCNTPFRFYKHYNHEGGIRTPMIVHWSNGLKTKGFTQEPGYITDFMPTICKLTGAKYPISFNDHPILPKEGISLIPALNGKPLVSRYIYVEHEGNKSVRDGDYKIVALKNESWELYNIVKDPTEMNNLAAKLPDRVKKLSDAWDTWAARINLKVSNSEEGKEENNSAVKRK